MATEPVYIPRSPGDLIAAEDWNNLQSTIKGDIGKQIKEAIKNLTTVPNSENTHKIDNQTSDDLTKAILEKVRQELPLRTGYRRLFKRIKVSEENVIKHDLGACPVVDIYQLDEFSVICSEDDEKKKEDTTLFYLYHTSERKLRATIGGATQTVEIETTGRTPFRIAFSEMLSLYKVSYTDTSSLGDLETEFWEAFLGAPNDEFDDDRYCHSPWFDRCCGEKRTVADLKQRGDWDDLWFKVMPRKTINFISGEGITAAPTQINVNQFDLNTIGIKLTGPAAANTRVIGGTAVPAVQDLPVMVILKV